MSSLSYTLSEVLFLIYDYWISWSGKIFFRQERLFFVLVYPDSISDERPNLTLHYGNR